MFWEDEIHTKFNFQQKFRTQHAAQEENVSSNPKTTDFPMIPEINRVYDVSFKGNLHNSIHFSS